MNVRESLGNVLCAIEDSGVKSDIVITVFLLEF